MSIDRLRENQPNENNPDRTTRFVCNGRSQSMMFRAYCPFCEQQVSATPMLDDEKVKGALHENGDVEVLHLSETGDHRWKLNRYEKVNLSKVLGGRIGPKK
jgi:hypothetical protein